MQQLMSLAKSQTTSSVLSIIQWLYVCSKKVILFMYFDCFFFNNKLQHSLLFRWWHQTFMAWKSWHMISICRFFGTDLSPNFSWNERYTIYHRLLYIKKHFFTHFWNAYPTGQLYLKPRSPYLSLTHRKKPLEQVKSVAAALKFTVEVGK